VALDLPFIGDTTG